MSNNILEFYNNSNCSFRYWIFPYSLSKSKFDPNEPLDKDKIHIFPFSFYTKYKSRGLSTMILDKRLDLNIDEDLEYIINRFHLKDVISVSEYSVDSQNIVVCLELENRYYKNLQKHIHILFHTYNTSPSSFISSTNILHDELISEDIVYIPNNTVLSSKIKLDIYDKYIITTNLILDKIFRFLTDSIFEEKSQSTLCIQYDNSDNTYVYDDYSGSEYDSDDSSDSRLSMYSYCKKYNLQMKLKTI
jgi:hypothetical protein